MLLNNTSMIAKTNLNWVQIGFSGIILKHLKYKLLNILLSYSTLCNYLCVMFN